ncbi:winged helix-turn-helix domain-containing protein [Pantoea sp. FN060301]|uniref:winged helix-turn-helix domain-containing protein n=1 Tax=Pantoea sp. FN060301 TaxID=3420380 RepID=UPI003D1717C2
MKRKYIINKNICFDPLLKKLTRMDTNASVIINYPAALCFLKLIKNPGEIIRQEEFMDEVWHKNGRYVSSNTFYQNISILRKALKKIGLGENMLITIPRKGLILTENMTIEIGRHDMDTHDTHINVKLKMPEDSVLSVQSDTCSVETKDQSKPLPVLSDHTSAQQNSDGLTICNPPYLNLIVREKSIRAIKLLAHIKYKLPKLNKQLILISLIIISQDISLKKYVSNPLPAKSECQLLK